MQWLVGVAAGKGVHHPVGDDVNVGERCQFHPPPGDYQVQGMKWRRRNGGGGEFISVTGLFFRGRGEGEGRKKV